ncbi:hypothetical protein BDV3_000731 [Batrachochytrium dendrobatidis]|nr:hypothetical protein O5D80_000392 [Batrachochytrium dendrobatidis]
MTSLLGFTNTVFTATMSGFSPFIAVYQGLFIFALFFQLLGSLDAYLSRNSMQVIAVGAFQILTLIYSAAQIAQMHSFQQCIDTYRTIGLSGMNQLNMFAAIWDLEQDGCPFRTVNKVNSTFYFTIGDSTSASPTNISTSINSNFSTITASLSLAYVVLVLMLIVTFVGVLVSRKTIDIFGWAIFYSHGADIAKRELLTRYHLFNVLLKVNVYFSIGIVLQMLSALYFSQKVQITMASVPANVGHVAALATKQTLIADQVNISRILFAIAGSIVLIVASLYYLFGYYGVRRGSKLLMGCFFVVMVFNASAVGFAFFEAIFNELYHVVKIWLATFAVIHFALNIATVVSASLCIRDFESGLPEIARSLGTFKIPSSDSIPSIVVPQDKLMPLPKISTSQVSLQTGLNVGNSCASTAVLAIPDDASFNAPRQSTAKSRRSSSEGCSIPSTRPRMTID